MYALVRVCGRLERSRKLALVSKQLQFVSSSFITSARRATSQDDELFNCLHGSSALVEVDDNRDHDNDCINEFSASVTPPLSSLSRVAESSPLTEDLEEESEDQGAGEDEEESADQKDGSQQDAVLHFRHKGEDEDENGCVNPNLPSEHLLELGIDQVGRGAVIGPIVLAAVALDSNSAAALQRAGVDDKKRPYRSLEREMEMYDTILTCVPEGMCKSVHISAEEIDYRRENGETLTDIETDAIETLVREFQQYALEDPQEARLERPSLRAVRVSAFSQGVTKEAVPRVASILPHKSTVDVSAIQSASVGGKSLAVSAAYVLAKTERALVMKGIERDTGQKIGSGFITDSKVDEFLTACVRRWRERMARKQELGIAPTSDAIYGRSVEANVGEYILE